jgi:hypothetical protein
MEHECEKIKLNTLIDLSDKYTSINKIVIDYVKTNLSEVNFHELYNKILSNTEFNILEYNINSECVTGWIDRMVLVHSNYKIFNKELNTQWFCGFMNNSCGMNYDDNLNYGIENNKQIKIYKNIEEALNNYTFNVHKDISNNLNIRDITMVIGWSIKITDKFPLKISDIRTSKKDNYDTIITDNYIIPLNRYQYIPIGCFKIELLKKHFITSLIRYCFNNDILSTTNENIRTEFNITYNMEILYKNILYTSIEYLHVLLSLEEKQHTNENCFVCFENNNINKIQCPHCLCEKYVHEECLSKCYKCDDEKSYYYNCDVCRCVTGNRIGKHYNDRCYKLHLEYPLLNNNDILSVVYIYEAYINNKKIYKYMLLPLKYENAIKCFEKAFRQNAILSNLHKFNLIRLEDYEKNIYKKSIDNFINECIEWGCGVSSFNFRKNNKKRKKSYSE